MEIRAPRICRIQQVPVGSLFVLVGGSKGNPICLRAAYDMAEEEADEANRVIPLHWPEDPTSVGATVYSSAMNGYAVILSDARLEVNPLSAQSTELGSLTAVYGREERLFFPVSYQGRLRGLVDAETGEILAQASGTYVAFEDWRITVRDDVLERTAILPLDEQEEAGD